MQGCDDPPLTVRRVHSRCRRGHRPVYRLTNAKFVPIAISARYVALFEGDVDVANVFSTDPQLAGGDYRLLEDPERLFGIDLNAAVELDDREPADVAAQFLRQAGLIDTESE